MVKYFPTDPAKSPFMAPSRLGLHPHLVISDSKENPQSMYEFENEVFDVLKDKNPQARLQQLRGVPDPNTKSNGFVQWVKDNPLLSLAGALAIGAVIAKALSSGEEGGDLDEVELDFDSASPQRKKNPGTVSTGDNGQVQAALSPAQVIITSPPQHQYITPLSPNQIITPPSTGKQSSDSVPQPVDAEFTQIVSKRRRRQNRVQTRRNDGTFTSATKIVRKQKRNKTGQFT